MKFKLKKNRNGLMKVFNTYITPKIILNILLGIALFGMIFILISVNRMNSLLNKDLGFNKDSIISVKTHESSVILPDSLIFSSDLPGFNVKNNIDVKTEYKKGYIKIAHQFISETYLDFFKYEKLVEKDDLFFDHGKAQLIYINESALKELGIYCIDDAPGTRMQTKNNRELIICGVVKDFESLGLYPEQQAIIYQLSSEHLAYAYYSANNSNYNEILGSVANITYQQRIQQQYRLWEDVIYSAFLVINVVILLICLGFIGNKYKMKKEGEFFKILGIGIHIITLIISKSYISLIAIVGFVAGPLAFLIQKLWLGIFEYRIHFGLLDLFIILSMALLTVYLVFCPKRKLENQLKGKSIQINSI